MLTDEDKKELKSIVVDAVQEVLQDVVMPVFETVALKSDLALIKNQVENIDRKLDRTTDKQLDHEQRIQNLEKTSLTI